MSAAPQGDPYQESVEELYEQSPCGYLTTNLDGRIVRVNRTVLDWLGHTREELLIGKRFVDLLTVGGRMYYETHLSLLLHVQGSLNEIALDLVRNDGRILPALVNAGQKRDSGGELFVYRYTIFNATERRQYERDLLAAKDLLHTTLSSIGDGVVATDGEGRITFMNPVAQALSGWNEDDARGRPIDDVLTLQQEDHGATVENPVTHALRVGAAVSLANHTVLIARDGTRRTIDDSASPIRNENGDVVGGVMVFRDVTERRATERSLAQARELGERMIARLQLSNEELAHFAAVASHDLRSPLNNVMQFAQILETKYSAQLGEGKAYLDVLLRAATRMGALIEDLLRYAAVTAEVTIAAVPIDANLPLTMAIENLQSEIEGTGATITHDALPHVVITETHLSQLFQNLIGNAIHYRGADLPRIHITAIDAGAYWRFGCTDNGIGIKSEYQEQIFEPFKRLHGTERPGSGIGLAICRRIIERAHGKLWVESEQRHGSTFYFTLPKLAPPAEE